MKGIKIDEYRPGRWRIRFSYKGERFPFYSIKWKGEKIPLTNLKLAEQLSVYIVGRANAPDFDPAEFRKEKTFEFQKAYIIWCETQSKNRQPHLQTYLRKYFTYFLDKDIRELRDIHLQEWVNWLKGQPISDQTQSNIRGVLKAVLNHFRSSINMILTVPPIKVQKKNVNWLPREVQELVFGHIPKKHLPIFTFLLYTGARPKEACDLGRENVKDGWINFEVTKTHNPRKLPVISEIEWTLHPKEVTPWIFSHRGKQYQTYKLSKIWRRACKKAKVEIDMYHGLKHSFATQRAIEGWKVEEIQAVLGHTTPAMTQRYMDMARREMLEGVMRGKVSSLNGISWIAK